MPVIKLHVAFAVQVLLKKFYQRGELEILSLQLILKTFDHQCCMNLKLHVLI